MSSETYHEPLDKLSRDTVLMHQAIRSLIEEWDAVDWYRQRADACADAELKAILLHNMREEIEHASMVLEWMRRNSVDVDRQLRTYLFSTGPITAVERQAEGGEDIGRA